MKQKAAIELDTLAAWTISILFLAVVIIVILVTASPAIRSKLAEIMAMI